MENKLDVFKEIGSHIRSKAGDIPIITVALGGVDSLAALIAACDEFGSQFVMAATIHSSFTNAFTNHVMRVAASQINVSYTSIDIGRPILEMMDCRIGLGKIETEKIGYTMDMSTRCEIIGGLRMVALRAIASRTESLLVGAIAADKISQGWCIPTAGMFDVNATQHFTRVILANAIKERFPVSGITSGITEVLERESGLDLLPTGGPYFNHPREETKPLSVDTVFLTGALL